MSAEPSPWTWAPAFLFLGLFIAVGLTVYLKGAFRPERHHSLAGMPAGDEHFMASVASLSNSLITEGRAENWWIEIEEVQAARLELIEQATKSIQFETFMMTPGRRADAFAEALVRKAESGVKVQLLADGYGAKDLPDAYWERLRRAGAEVRFFNPLSLRAPLDYLRRNHRKLLIVDQDAAMMGGAGISDLWDGDDGHPEGNPWYDIEVQWRGEVVGMLTGFFLQHWLNSGGHVDLTEYPRNTPRAVDGSPVLTTPGDEPSSGDSPIRSLFQLTILSARERLWISTPYLLPDDPTCTLLGDIRERGVDVRILTMGPRSDKSYVWHTSRQRYDRLLERDIGIHEYQPAMMHGKCILVDRHWVSIGSANLDPRSFFHNDELNLCSNAPALMEALEAYFETGFERSQLIDRPTWEKRPVLHRVVGGLGNFFYWQL